MGLEKLENINTDDLFGSLKSIFGYGKSNVNIGAKMASTVDFFWAIGIILFFGILAYFFIYRPFIYNRTVKVWDKDEEGNFVFKFKDRGRAVKKNGYKYFEIMNLRRKIPDIPIKYFGKPEGFLSTGTVNVWRVSSDEFFPMLRKKEVSLDITEGSMVNVDGKGNKAKEGYVTELTRERFEPLDVDYQNWAVLELKRLAEKYKKDPTKEMMTLIVILIAGAMVFVGLMTWLGLSMNYKNTQILSGMLADALKKTGTGGAL